MTSAGAAGAAGALSFSGASKILAQYPLHFHLRSRMTSFSFSNTLTEGLVSLKENAPPPVIKLKQGERAVLDYENGLDQYSTIHWHGIRLPNAMDGVPYLTQLPVAGGETFRYTYIPPDAGTYWYHPHCMTMSQMALGLTGILIVEERQPTRFDADIPLNLKDFRLAENGTLLPHFTARGAARGGTLGNVRTTNWKQAPTYDVPAGGMIRLRIVVTDTARVHKLIFPGVPGRIIAWDGHPIEEEVPWPTFENPLLLGPGQRVDVALPAPADEGKELTFHSLLGRKTFVIAKLRSNGQSLGRTTNDIPLLPRNPFKKPDMKRAQTHELVFGWSPEGNGTNNGLCGTFGYVFWSINRKPWPGDAEEGTEPLLTMQLGQSYILRMRNESPNFHPIHLHGLVFKPVSSNLRQIPANYTDTLLLLKNEVVDVAILADNLGDWAFHCHVIEHQKSGLSGFIRVT